jgi:hypothetical protein
MQRHAGVPFAPYAPQLPVRRDRSPRAPVSTHPPQLAGVGVHRTAVKKGLSVRCDKAEPVVPLPLAANCFTSCDFGSLESMGAGTHVTKLLAVADDATPRRSRSALSNACADRTGRTTYDMHHWSPTRYHHGWSTSVTILSIQSACRAARGAQSVYWC